MKCPHCRAKVKEGDTFCGECGKALMPERDDKVTKTALGLNENTEGLLCYSLTWLTGIIFLLLEKENKFVRFHAIQSLATFLPLSLLNYLFVALSVETGDDVVAGIVGLLSIILFILWLLLMYKAYKGERFKLPIVGDFAEKHS